MTPLGRLSAARIELFRRRQDNNDFLVEQSVVDVYCVVASAYDYDLARTHQRVLLWRTRMTVASERQSLPALVAAAAPYFGRDMPLGGGAVAPVGSGRLHRDRHADRRGGGRTAGTERIEVSSRGKFAATGATAQTSFTL